VASISVTELKKMRQEKQSSMAAVALLIFIIALLKDGASGVHVDVFPRNPTIKVGQNFTFMCRVGKPLMYCSIRVPGFNSGLNMNENTPRTNNYWYEGDGISKGQCGITIARIDDKQNGQFRCSLGFSDEQSESDGFTNVTVARAPTYNPTLVVSPEPDRVHRAYNEDTVIKAMCTVRDARPAANIVWYIGDEQITDGVTRPEIMESGSDLFTVQQNLTRRLIWKDSGRDLKCTALHIALDDRPKQTTKQISVRFAPRPLPAPLEQFGFIVGEEGIITVQIHANPKPYLTWIVDQESINEDSSDSTKRFHANRIQDMGNSTWLAELRIMPVTVEDVERKYELTAQNEVGKEKYTVRISTSTEPPESLELGTGPIIGIVVSVLVLLIIIFMVIFARATGRWCFSGGAPARHDNKESETFIKDSQTQGSNPNKGDSLPDEQKSLTSTVKVKESSDTESADHGPAEKSKKPKMNLTYILKKKKDKVAADAEDLKVMEKPGTESSEHIVTSTKGKPHGQDVVYAELDLQSTQRPVVRREDDKTEYAEIVHTKAEEEGEGAQ